MNEKYLQVWQEYVALESSFEVIISHIPLTKNHFDVWSLKIGDLLIVLGSVVDSFFKLSLNDSEFDDIDGVKEIREGKHHTIKEYRELFEKYYELSKKKIYIRSMDIFIYPFKDWTSKDSPFWWNGYQQIKHNRFINKEQATLENLLYGMAGLFLLNTIHLPSRQVLRRLNYIKTYWNKLGEGYLESLVIDKEPIGEQSNSLEIFYVETKIFGYVFESLNPESKDDEAQRSLLALLKAPRF